MSTDEDDIIELDSDGNFVVPESESMAGKATRVQIEVEGDESDEDGVQQVKVQATEKVVEKTPKELMGGIAVGEYKIFKYANKVDVMVHLDKPSSEVKNVTVDAGTLKISFLEKGAASLTVDISDYVVAADKAVVAAYSYKDFLSVRFE